MTSSTRSGAPLRAAQSTGPANGSSHSEALRDTLAVVIPTFNVEHLIRDCLESVKWADEIIVVDMFSTDATVRICQEYPNCRVYPRHDYIFGNVNFGFDQATTDWIIRLDSDERISPELREEVLAMLRVPAPRVTCYTFSQELYLLGHRVANGRARGVTRKMLFKRGTARYEVRSEHEDITVTGTCAAMKQSYLHFNYDSVSHYLQKMDYYTSRDVERMPCIRQPDIRRAVVEAIRNFIYLYVRLTGWRDGWIGFIDAGMRAIYIFVQEAKYWHKYVSTHPGLERSPSNEASS